MKQEQLVTVTGVNANRPYRVVDVGELRAARLEPVDEPAASPAEAETAAPRFVVVTSGESLSDKYEVGGAVMLAADAPDMETLKGMFGEYLGELDPPVLYFKRPAGIARDLLGWLVEMGFAQRVEALECNVMAWVETMSGGQLIRHTYIDTLALPWNAEKEK